MLSKVELKLIGDYLEELVDRFGNDGCNDQNLEDTPEHRRLVEAANVDFDPVDGDPIEIQDGEIITFNVVIVGHLRERIKQELA